jgi:hypothetical protein
VLDEKMGKVMPPCSVLGETVEKLKGHLDVDLKRILLYLTADVLLKASVVLVLSQLLGKEQ